MDFAPKQTAPLEPPNDSKVNDQYNLISNKPKLVITITISSILYSSPIAELGFQGFSALFSARICSLSLRNIKRDSEQNFVSFRRVRIKPEFQIFNFQI